MDNKQEKQMMKLIKKHDNGDYEVFPDTDHAITVNKKSGDLVIPQELVLDLLKDIEDKETILETLTVGKIPVHDVKDLDSIYDSMDFTIRERFHTKAELTHAIEDIMRFFADNNLESLEYEEYQKLAIMLSEDYDSNISHNAQVAGAVERYQQGW